MKINIAESNARNRGIENAIKDGLPRDTIMALVEEHLNKCRAPKKRRSKDLEYWESLIALRQKQNSHE